MTPHEQTTLKAECPSCHAKVTVRLAAGDVCPQCASSQAWERYGESGERLVIRKKDIVAAESRPDGEGRSRVVALLVRYWLPAIVGVVLALAGAWLVRDVLAPKPIGPLEDLVSERLLFARLSLGLGFLAFAVGCVSTLMQKRGAVFRVAPLLAMNLSTVLMGGLVSIVSASVWFGTGFGWDYVTMPPITSRLAPLSETEERIIKATTVVLAPDKNGDANAPALGAGAVIQSDRHTAYVVTSSHVAMPYASVAAFRDPEDAHPVWVYFSDGRHAQGRVIWMGEPPIDVALVRVPIAKPPRAVPVKASADAADLGFSVSFVPNPMRGGWMIHHGQVLNREMHRTPAGDFNLIYTSLPVQPGDSGTGLFDSLGRLIGLNTWTRYEEGGPKGISLPSNTMERVLELMQNGGVAASAAGSMR